jgi:uridine phosphorylase
MSLRDDRQAFEAAYASRSNQTWALPVDSPGAQVRQWSPHVLAVTTSPEYGDRIEGLLEKVVYRDSFLAWTRAGLPTESLAGWYANTRVTVIHQGITPGCFGASYMDMVLEPLRGRSVRDVVVLGELSSLQTHVQIGDLVVATSAVRDDDSHRTYAAPEVPAAADLQASRALEVAARATGRRTHTGVCWSCGAGAGIFDPLLAERAFALSQVGMLGNALEAATAFLLGRSLQLRVGSLWLAADSVYQPITWEQPSPRLGWEDGWHDLVRAGLDALAKLAGSEPA